MKSSGIALSCWNTLSLNLLWKKELTVSDSDVKKEGMGTINSVLRQMQIALCLQNVCI
jgi:hypothetical protein